jgi:hypothetical protein
MRILISKQKINIEKIQLLIKLNKKNITIIRIIKSQPLLGLITENEIQIVY